MCECLSGSFEIFTIVFFPNNNDLIIRIITMWWAYHWCFHHSFLLSIQFSPDNQKQNFDWNKEMIICIIYNRKCSQESISRTTRLNQRRQIMRENRIKQWFVAIRPKSVECALYTQFMANVPLYGIIEKQNALDFNFNFHGAHTRERKELI